MLRRVREHTAEWATPFLDADDIAYVAVAVLTEDGHVGQLYKLTGPPSITFAEAAAEIAAAAGREIRYVPVSLYITFKNWLPLLTTNR